MGKVISQAYTPTNAANPISLATAKAHLRIDFDFEDTIIQTYLDAALAYFERYTGFILRPSAAVIKTLGIWQDEDFLPYEPKTSTITRTTSDDIYFNYAYSVGNAAIPPDALMAVLAILSHFYEQRGIASTLPYDTYGLMQRFRTQFA